MKPTISSVAPSSGHTGGRSFVEISGTNFREPPEPPPTGVAPPPPRTVRVLFGGVEALTAVAAGPDMIWATTPIHDAGAVDVTVQNLGEKPAVLVSGAAPFALSGGETLELSVGGAAAQVVFSGGDFAVPGAATAEEVASRLNDVVAASAVVVAGRVHLRTDARGPAARLRAVAGSALGPLGFGTTEVTGSAELEPIAGEEATLVGGYAFVMPDLDAEVPLTRAIGQLLVELRRQVHPNVNIATSPEYDEETGDLLNITPLASMPSIILAQLEILPSTARQTGGYEEAAGEGDATVLRAPAIVGDVTMTLVGVAEGPKHAYALLSTTRGFFRKNATLTTSAGEEYELEWVNGPPLNVTVEQGTSNIVTFAGQVTIRGVPVDELPLPDAVASPPWMPSGTPRDTVTGVTWPNETTELDIVRKTDPDE